MPERSQLGFYGAWRAVVQYDADPSLHELPDWQEIIAELPVDALDAIILQLTRLEIPQTIWEGYLRRLALELPGWSGLINWRQHIRIIMPSRTQTPSRRLSGNTVNAGSVLVKPRLPRELANRCQAERIANIFP